MLFSIFFLKFFAMAVADEKIRFNLFQTNRKALKVSIGVFPVFTDAILAPLPINAKIPPV